MWVEQTKTGYRLVERYTDPLTDKKRKVSVKLEKNTKQAINKARPLLIKKIEEKLQNNIIYDDITLEELIEEFKRIKYSSLSENTKSTYDKSFAKLLGYYKPDIKINKITTRSLNLLFSEIGVYSRLTTLKLYKNRIKILFDYAVSIKAIKENPTNNIILSSKIKPKEKVKFLSHDEVVEVLDLVYSQNNSIFPQLTEFLLFTGCRIGEALNLTWDDVDFKNKTLSINKHLKTKNSKRIIFLTDNILEMLKKLDKKDKKIFSGYSNNYYNEWLKNLNYKHHLYPHLFRHTHISMLAELGINIKAIMKRVGHSDSKTTLDIYTHVTQKMEDDMIDKLNSYID